MKYLVDANILSEPTKPAPDQRVLDWLRVHELDITVDPLAAISLARMSWRKPLPASLE